MTGRAAGFCAGYDMPGYANAGTRGGRGRGGAWGRGGGRGRRWAAYPAGPLQEPVPAAPVPQQDLTGLGQQVTALQAQLEAIQNQLQQMQKPDGE